MNLVDQRDLNPEKRQLQFTLYKRTLRKIEDSKSTVYTPLTTFSGPTLCSDGRRWRGLEK